MSAAAEVRALFADPVTASLVELVLDLEAGSRLPSERDLGDQLGVSRTALRDRLRYLEALGVVERRVGAGTFVRGVQPEVLSQALTIGLLAADMTMPSLHSVRWALERQAAYEAARSADEVAVAHMSLALRTMEGSQDPEALHDADVIFHEAMIGASRSPALVFLSRALADILNRTVETRAPHDHPHVRGLHREIHDAVAEGDEQGAMAAVDAHFRWALESPPE